MKIVNKAQTAHEELIPLLCRMVGAKSYLELGVYKGDCLKAVARANPLCKCEGVDHKQFGGLLDKPANVIFHFTSIDLFLGDLPADVVFDVVFIDGDHSAKSVAKNLADVWPHVADHGLVLLHDTYPADEASTEPGYCGDAWRFVANMPKIWLDDAEAVTLPYHPGLTIVRKRTRHLAWEPK